MTFHMPDSWYDPPAAHECEDGENCECEQKAQDQWEQAQIARYEAHLEDERIWHDSHN